MLRETKLLQIVFSFGLARTGLDHLSKICLGSNGISATAQEVLSLRIPRTLLVTKLFREILLYENP